MLSSLPSGATTFIASYLAFSSVSFLANRWLLHRLTGLKPLSKSLVFRRQLLALTIANSVWALYGIIFKVMYAMGISYTRNRCQIELIGRAFLEFSSSLIELQVAMGFFAASFRATRFLNLLSVSVPGAFVLSALLLPFDFMYADIQVDANDPGACNPKQHFWDEVVSICFFGSVAFYVVGAFGTRSGPLQVRRRAMLCGFCYMVSFWATFGIHAGQNWFRKAAGPSHAALAIIVSNLVCLNGAMNVCTYALFTWRFRGTGSEYRVGFRRNMETSVEVTVASSEAINQSAVEDSFQSDCSDAGHFDL